MKASKQKVHNRKIRELSKARAKHPNERLEARRQAVIDQARRIYEGIDIEIYNDALISEAHWGVWVQAWVWVAGAEETP